MNAHCRVARVRFKAHNLTLIPTANNAVPIEERRSSAALLWMLDVLHRRGGAFNWLAIYETDDSSGTNILMHNSEIDSDAIPSFLGVLARLMHQLNVLRSESQDYLGDGPI